MTPEQIFDIANPAALIGWIALALGPLSPLWTARVALTIATAQSALYAALVLVYFAGAEGGYDTLPNVMLLFANPGTATAGWVHYLAFDLLVGIWITHTARKDGVPHVLVLPCLFATLMFGPVGFILFLAIRATFLLRANRTQEA